MTQWTKDALDAPHTQRELDEFPTRARDQHEAEFDMGNPMSGQPVAREAAYHCDRCRRGITMDAVVSHDLWAKISPTGDDGGLLCASCMVDEMATATDWPAIAMVSRHDPSIAQPVAQKPVAWQQKNGECWVTMEDGWCPHDIENWKDYEFRPLYAHPATPAPAAPDPEADRVSGEAFSITTEAEAEAFAKIMEQHG